MDILVAKEAGFCFGVKRALRLAQRTLERYGKAYTLGPLIHNPQVVQCLTEKGLIPVEDPSQVGKGPVVIRSHGIGKEVYEVLRRRGVEIVDATCPRVKRVQRLAYRLSKKGYFVIVVGEKGHAEVKGIMSYVEGRGLVVEDPQEIPEGLEGEKIAILSQTTQEPARVGEILKALFPLGKELLVFNTLCEVTVKRQKEALWLASQVDCMIVLGGRNSANTNRLVEICRRVQPRTYHLEDPRELKEESLEGVKKIGITAGASTPPKLIKALQETLVKRGFCGIKEKGFDVGGKDARQP